MLTNKEDRAYLRENGWVNADEGTGWEKPFCPTIYTLTQAVNIQRAIDESRQKGWDAGCEAMREAAREECRYYGDNTERNWDGLNHQIQAYNDAVQVARAAIRNLPRPEMPNA